jgi:hypothetical protein
VKCLPCAACRSQRITTARRKILLVIGQTGDRSAAAEWDASAERAKILAAGLSHQCGFLARGQCRRGRRPRLRSSGRWGGRRLRSAGRCAGWRATCCCSDRLLARRGKFCDIALQTLKGSRAAGRNARTVRLVVAAAGLADRVRLSLRGLLRVGRKREHTCNCRRQQGERGWYVRTLAH